jgi:hypothetical protein
MHGLLGPDLAAQDQVRAVRDHLVRIHVGGRPRSGLEDVQHEVGIQVAVHHLLRGLLDRTGAFGVQ